jgi:hypothetical protein
MALERQRGCGRRNRWSRKLRWGINVRLPYSEIGRLSFIFLSKEEGGEARGSHLSACGNFLPTSDR